MAAGTITLTNGSAIVGGTGTSFATELAAGDFIVSTVGGVSYTLPVKSVESNAQLTLVSNFTGPTQSGAAWSAVPRVALNMVTAALVAQSAEALRGLNYDKQNWQQVYSAAGNITVKLPDGTTFTGPSWKYLSNNMATKIAGAVPVNQGGTGSTNAFDAATNLSTIRSFTRRTVSGDDLSALFFRNMSGFIVGQQGYAPVGAFLDITSFDNQARMQIYGCYDSQMFGARNALAYATYNPNNNAWNPIAFVRDTLNTTVDSNGFIKSASPIVNVYGDGRYETNDESEGVMVTRLDVGHYLIEGCNALNSDAAWGGIDGGFEIPTDRNKQPLIWLDYEVNPDGSVLVKTYHRSHPGAPAFVRNERAGLADGEPVDIPNDQFVSVRVEMPASSIWNQKQKQTEEALKQEQGS